MIDIPNQSNVSCCRPAMLRVRVREKLLFAILLLIPAMVFAQGPVPFTVQNASTFSDADLYVAIMGIDYTTGNHVWVNAQTSAVLPMSTAYNTLTGPTIGGNTGPGLNSKYANCFTRLSDISNITFTLPLIAGCRVFISKGQPLYFYFFGANGSPSGYTSPNPLNATDPNQGILYEIIELTNNQYGFFGNPSRVDSYKYPMGLELFGSGGYQKRVGELKTHAEIVSLFNANVPAGFLGCVNSTTGEITAPSKTPAFADGTNGTSIGSQANYLKSYIDAIWEKYKNEDLIFYAGDAGVFKGRVTGEQLIVVGQSGGFAGRTGIVGRRPTTQEALEGKGILDNRIGDGDLDLVVQAQLTAAINRHVVNTTTPNPGQQNWYDVSTFYQSNPMNYYSRFWHLPGISVDQLAYGFAYDDVADQSPSLHTTSPTKVIATFGGYAGTLTNGVVTLYQDCNYGGYAVSLPVGDYTLSQLQAKGVINDDISSLKVQSGYEIQVFQNDLYGGASFVFIADDACLVDNGINDYISSVKVRTKTPFTQTIQAENYSAMLGIQTETTTDTGGGLDVGYTDTGDWMAFDNITFPTTGSYLFEYRVASAVGTSALSLDLNAGTIPLGTVNVPNTGGWQNWTIVSHVVTINAGTYNVGIYIQSSGLNINWFRITRTGVGAREALPEPTLIETPVAHELYPNPVAHSFTIRGAKGGMLSIVNAQGMELSSELMLTDDKDVSHLPAGIYHVIVVNGNQRVIKRFVKK